MEKAKGSGCLYFGMGCCGCPILVLILLAVLAGGLLVGVRFTGPFDEALDLARSDERLQAEIGEPMKAGLGVSASYNSDDAGSAINLRIPISGPHGEAMLFADALRDDGRWRFLLLEAELQDGRVLDLLDQTYDSEDVI